MKGLRRAARAAVVAGAAGSLGLMLYAGRHQRSVILILLFAGWVLSPFAGAALAGRSAKLRAAFDIAVLVFSLGSLSVYAEAAFGHTGVKTGFVFLVVPAISWLLLLVGRLVGVRG